MLVWTNDTTRATTLAYQDGVLVKTGATTRRYLGTLYASGANTTEDSFAKRYLWNCYHRMDRLMLVIEGTNSWTYSTATYRQANAAAANQLDAVIGISEDLVHAEVVSTSSNNSVFDSGLISVTVGVGVDSTTVNSANVFAGLSNTVSIGERTAVYRGYPAAGRHTFVWLEAATAIGTTTWYGDNGTTFVQSGITGRIRG